MKNALEKVGRIQIIIITVFTVALITLPLTIRLLQQQQNTQSNAVAATILSFEPVSSQTEPIQADLNQNIPLNIMIDPGTNEVSILTLVMQYDPAKFETTQDSLQVNTAVFGTTLEGPIYNPGQVAVKVSIGSDPTRAVKQKVRAATLNLLTKDGTGINPTSVVFTPQTTALSIGSGESATENVVQTTQPAQIVIAGDVVNPTTPPQQSPIPTYAQNSPLPTNPNEPTEIPVTPIPTEQPIPTGIGGEQPIPTYVVPTIKPGSGNKHWTFRDFFRRLFINRIINIRNIFWRMHKGKNIPPGQVNRLYKEREQYISLLTQLLELLKSGQFAGQQNTQQENQENKQEIAMATKASFNVMLNDYLSASNQLNAFTPGLESVIKDKEKKGENVTEEKAALEKVKRNTENIKTLTKSCQDSLETIDESNTKAIISTVKSNMQKIKGEFTSAKQNLQQIKEKLNKQNQ